MNQARQNWEQGDQQREGEAVTSYAVRVYQLRQAVERVEPVSEQNVVYKLRCGLLDRYKAAVAARSFGTTAELLGALQEFETNDCGSSHSRPSLSVLSSGEVTRSGRNLQQLANLMESHEREFLIEVERKRSNAEVSSSYLDEPTSWQS